RCAQTRIFARDNPASALFTDGFEAFELSTTRTSRLRRTHSAAAPACSCTCKHTNKDTKRKPRLRQRQQGVRNPKSAATLSQAIFRTFEIAIAQQIEGSSPADLYEEVCRPDAAQQPADPKDCRDMYSRQRSWIESETR